MTTSSAVQSAIDASGIVGAGIGLVAALMTGHAFTIDNETLPPRIPVNGFRASLRACIAMACATMSGACLGSDDCLSIPLPQFDFSVRSPSGADLTSTASFVVRRLDGTPPAPVDSAFGGVFEVRFRYSETPGRFHVTINHEGFVPEDRVVLSVPDPWAGPCGPDVKHQVITVTLAPRAGSEPGWRGAQ